MGLYIGGIFFRPLINILIKNVALALFFLLGVLYASEAQAVCGFGSSISGGRCQGFITTTGAGTFTVPGDWSSTNQIEVIGGGGGGGSGTGGNDNGGGGGGGYAKVTNLTGLTGTITTQVGAGGIHGTSGGQTWFNGANAAAASVSVNGGTSSGDSNPTGGAGGTVINGTGFAGGAGGTSTNINNGGAGGGGAGAPSGIGRAGGASTNNAGSGGGGAGAGLATAGSDGGSVGGAGGTAQDGTAGGAGGVNGVSAAGAGSHGSGGGGGAGGASFTMTAGGVGGDGIEWDSTHGAGGGGGASGFGQASLNPAGGAGGNYGGGGGGSDFTIGEVGGLGAPGIIVITYTPTGATVGIARTQFLDLGSLAGSAGTSLTTSYANTGNILFVYLSATAVPASVNFNGTPLTVLYDNTISGTGSVTYYLKNPAVTTANIVVDFGAAQPSMEAVAVSYSGVDLGAFDATSNTLDGVSEVTYSSTVATVTDNSWGVGFAHGITGNVNGGFSGSFTTVVIAAAFLNTAIGDTNAAVHPAGNLTFSSTSTSGANTSEHVFVSLRPVVCVKSLATLGVGC